LAYLIDTNIDGLTLFGLVAVTAMLVTYALESRTLVHPGLRRSLSARVDLRFPARGLAVRASRGDLGDGCAEALAQPLLTQ
jgi:hypothetical protein